MLDDAGLGCRTPREELELAYPSLEAVEELELNDLTRLEDDFLYGAGMKVVQAILDEMSVCQWEDAESDAGRSSEEPRTHSAEGKLKGSLSDPFEEECEIPGSCCKWRRYF